MRCDIRVSLSPQPEPFLPCHSLPFLFCLLRMMVWLCWCPRCLSLRRRVTGWLSSDLCDFLAHNVVTDLLDIHVRHGNHRRRPPNHVCASKE
ncbi:hypothetical protein V8D89_013495 [Ganoderma adspersum]